MLIIWEKDDNLRKTGAHQASIVIPMIHPTDIR